MAAEGITATTDLAEASRPMRKAIMRELTGLHHLQAGALRAGARRKEVEEQLDRDASEISRLSTELEQLPAVRRRLAELERQAGDLEERRRELEAQIDARRGESQRAQEAARRADEAQSRCAALDEQDQQLSRERAALAGRVESLRAAVAGKGDAERALALGVELEARRGELIDEQARINDSARALLAAHQAAVADHQEQAQEVQREAADVRRRVEHLASQHRTRTERAAALEAELNRPDWTVCGGCGREFPPAQLGRVQDELRQKRVELTRVQSEAQELEASVAGGRLRLQELDERLFELDPPAQPKLPVFDATRLSEVEGRIRAVNLPAARRTIELATEAAATSAAARRRIGEIGTMSEGIRNRRSALAREIDERVYARRDELLTVLRGLESDAAGARAEQARTAAHREHAEEQLDELVRKEGQLAACRTAAEQRRRDGGDWRLLEQALGADGVQALELEALAPGIAEVANRLLAESHGGRFRIRFDLQRPSGAGAKRKLVEDFRIVVYDAAHAADHSYHQDLGPGEQLMETLSGGEAVWCREALYTAFSVVRARNSGLRFLTCFLDEADDGLDPDAKESYFRLLEAAHHETERHQTIVITHAPAIQQTIGQVIELAPAAGAPPLEATHG